MQTTIYLQCTLKYSSLIRNDQRHQNQELSCIICPTFILDEVGVSGGSGDGDAIGKSNREDITDDVIELLEVNKMSIYFLVGCH